MKYLLDTSVISELISSQPNPNVVQFVDSLDQEDIYLSAITVGEIAKAIQKQPDPTRKQSLQKWLHEDLLVRFDGRIISLDPNIMTRWGELSAKIEGIGIEFPAIDAMIAASVLTHEMILVTMYENDFKNTNIEVINPFELDTKLEVINKEGDFFETINQFQINFIFPESFTDSEDVDAAYREAERKIDLAQKSGWIELNLSKLGLTTIPDSLAQLTELQTLNLSNNQLTELPNFLEKLVNLKHLNLYHNNITSLPASIFSLSNLQELGIGYNSSTILSQRVFEIKKSDHIRTCWT